MITPKVQGIQPSLYASILDGDDALEYALSDDRCAYVHVARRTVTVNGVIEFMNREPINTVLHSGVDSIRKLNDSHVRRA